MSRTWSLGTPRGPMPSAKSQRATRPSPGGSPPAVSASSSCSASARRQTLGLSSLPLKWLPPVGSPAITKLAPPSPGAIGAAPRTQLRPGRATMGESRLLYELRTGAW